MAFSKVTLNGTTLMDIRDTTAKASDVRTGKKFYGADGEPVIGTNSGSGTEPSLQAKTATPTKSQQVITADSNYDGLSTVTVEPIPSQYIVPSGNKAISSNGTGIDVTNFATVSVAVPTGSTINNQNKTVTPTESSQSVTADSGYTGLGTVTVNAISSTYVGSGVTRRDETDLTASGATVTVPAGYYAEQETKSVATGIVNSPTLSYDATKPDKYTVDVTVNSGYITAGRTQTAGISTVFPTQAAATITPTETSQTAVAQYKWTTGAVTVAAIPSTYVGSGVTQRDETDLTTSGATVTVPSGFYAEQETKSVSTTTHPAPTASINSTTGLVTASHTQTAGYVTAGTTTGTLQLTTQAAATITPTKSSQTAVAAGRYTTGAVTVAAIPAQYITTTDATASADDIVSGETAYVNGSKLTGSLVIQHYYTGSSTPSSSLGANGDIYLQA